MTFNSAEEYLESVKKQPPAVISNTNCPYCNAKRQLAQSGKNTGVEGFVGLLIRGEIANKKTGNKIPNMNPDELSNHLRNYIQHEKDPKIDKEKLEKEIGTALSTELMDWFFGWWIQTQKVTNEIRQKQRRSRYSYNCNLRDI